MTDFATRNAERAGVRQYIEFKTADALQRPVPCERGVLMFNPPYGERIDTKGSVRNAYRARSEADEEMGEPAPDVRAPVVSNSRTTKPPPSSSACLPTGRNNIPAGPPGSSARI
jgi:23S rRNA G2445 N2-methylase RlmL